VKLRTDGVTPKISRFINGLNPQQYKAWLELHLKICRAEAAIQNTLQASIIAEKD